MGYFKGEKVELVDSQGGVWIFKPFTPRIRNKVLKEMEAANVDVMKTKEELQTEGVTIDSIELNERVIKACYIDAPKAVKSEFKEAYGRKFTADDILESDVFDELADALIEKPSKN